MLLGIKWRMLAMPVTVGMKKMEQEFGGPARGFGCLE